MEPSSQTSSDIRGAVLGSLAPAVLCFVHVLAGSLDLSAHNIVTAFVAAFLLSLPIAAAAMFIIGLPLVMLLRRLRIYSLWTVVAGAICTGAIILYGVASFGSSEQPGSSSLFIGSAYGLIAGCAFYLGARPNNSFKPTPLRGAA